MMIWYNLCMEIKDCEEILYEINKSKFVGYAYSVEDVDSANSKLEKIRKMHEKATHVCYAYVISSPHMEKCSDDGEPDGTAGRPILEVIKKNDLSNVLLIVVRYFGGIKLGAGGLVRAYSTSAKNTIDKAEKMEYCNCFEYTVSTSIDNKKVLDRLQGRLGFEILSKEFSSDFSAKLIIDKEIDNQFIENNINILQKQIVKLPKRN